MRVLGLVVVLAACSRPQPIGAINAVIGDASFIRAFGRFPTPADDPDLRVATHLRYVSAALRARPSASPVRARLLDALDRYIALGRFPHGDVADRNVPAFVDRTTGARCAVGYLLEADGGGPLVAELDRAYHHAYIGELAGDPRFAAWAAHSGFTLEELATIQPEYAPRPEHELEVDAGAGYRAAVAHDPADLAPHQLGLARVAVRALADERTWVENPFVDLVAELGAADRGGLAYGGHARLGWRFEIGRYAPFEVSAGAGVDGIGDAVPRAWTFPLDISQRANLTRRVLAGIHGGVRFAIGDRPTGWNAGIDVTRVRDFYDIDLRARALRFALDVDRYAGALYLGLSVTVLGGNQAPRE
jgi:hypothetical protein